MATKEKDKVSLHRLSRSQLEQETEVTLRERTKRRRKVDLRGERIVPAGVLSEGGKSYVPAIRTGWATKTGLESEDVMLRLDRKSETGFGPLWGRTDVRGGNARKKGTN